MSRTNHRRGVTKTSGERKEKYTKIERSKEETKKKKREPVEKEVNTTQRPARERRSREGKKHTNNGNKNAAGSASTLGAKVKKFQAERWNRRRARHWVDRGIAPR